MGREQANNRSEGKKKKITQPKGNAGFNAMYL